MRFMDRRLLRRAAGHRGWWAAVVVLGLGAGIATVAQAVLLARIVDRVFLGDGGWVAVSGLAAAAALAIVVRAALVAAERLAARRLAERVAQELRALTVEHIARLGPVGVGTERAGELRTVLTEGVDEIHGWFQDYLPQVALSALVPLLVAAVVFRLDLLSALVLLVTAPLIPLFMVLIGRRAETHSRRQLDALGRLGAAFLDLVQGLPTLAMMGRAEAQVARAAALTQDLRRTTMTTLRLAFLSALALELLSTLSTAVVAVEVGLRLLYGRMAFVDAFAVLLLAPEFYLPLRLLGQRFHSGMAGVAAADRLFEILDRPPVVKDAASDAPTAMPDHPVVALKQVTVRYPEAGAARRADALRSLTLTLERGERLALVGESGSGKSSVLNLLLRFVDPAAGRLLADGVDACDIAPDAWRERFSWVPQAPWLFEGTVAENVRMGRPDASDEALREAAARARADQFIHELPMGWDTPLGERGARLSGGQAQRLALARAFLRDAPIVLLDEPGAGLDPRTLVALDEGIESLLEGRSAVIVAHRLASVERAQRVVVMDGGTIVDQGRPDEVLHRPGPFRRLLAGEGA
jgi:ATP-binding cassette subfamily C protein CydD